LVTLTLTSNGLDRNGIAASFNVPVESEPWDANETFNVIFQYILKGQNDISLNVTRLIINSLSRILRVKTEHILD
jgi:hypothetical protein